MAQTNAQNDTSMPPSAQQDRPRPEKATLESLPAELRLAIYEYVLETPLSDIRCVEVAEMASFDYCMNTQGPQDQIWGHYHGPIVVWGWNHFAGNSFHHGDWKVSHLLRTYVFFPVGSVSRLLGDVRRLALVSRRLHSDVTDLLYKDLTFSVFVGIQSAWGEDWSASNKDTDAEFLRFDEREGVNIPINGLEAVNADLLRRITSLKLTIRDIVDRRKERLLVEPKIEAFVLRMQQEAHTLQRLEVDFAGVGYATSLPVSNSSRYQYLLEPLAALRVPEFRIQGVTEDFASKLAAVITRQYVGTLQEIDYGTETIMVSHRAAGRRKRKAAEMEREVQRSRKTCYDPKYDWAAVVIPAGESMGEAQEEAGGEEGTTTEADGRQI